MASLTAVTFGAGLPGLLGGPKGAPAVIVIQEWWGITENVKAQALRVAAEGYRVLVPDIYKGKMGVDKEEAHHLMSNLDFPGAVKEIGAAAAFLKGEGSPKVGIAGFCMGGALALGALAASEDLICGAPFYGVIFGLFDPTKLAAKPVEGHFGAEDTMAGFSCPATAAKLQEVLRAAGQKDATCHVYAGVGHAFMNEAPDPYASFEERQQVMGFPPYDKAQADLAWSRAFAFFAKHLK